MSEIRENKITGEWVIIAPERAKRGGNLVRAAERIESAHFLPSCPFCFGNEALTAEERFRVDEDGRWVLRSVVNKFSVLSPTGEVTLPSCPSEGESSVNGVGLHEVLIESPWHDVSMAIFPIAHMQRILEAYRHRFCEFYMDYRIQHVIVFTMARMPAPRSSIRILKSLACRSFRDRSSTESSGAVGFLMRRANALPVPRFRRSGRKVAGSSLRTPASWRSFLTPRCRHIIFGSFQKRMWHAFRSSRWKPCLRWPRS
jgi:hypothetical protein